MRKTIIQCYRTVEMRVVMSNWGPGEHEGDFTEEMVFERSWEED